MVLAHDLQKWFDKRREKQEREEREKRKKEEEEARQRRQKAREAILKEGRAQGIEIGRSLANKAWHGWNYRRLDAQSRGQKFTEPPPDHPSPHPPQNPPRTPSPSTGEG